MTELFNTYLNTDGIANKIVVLSKKTSSSQFEMGELILSVKNQVKDLIDPLKSKKAVLDAKDKSSKKSIDEKIKAVVAEYDLFLSTLPFGKVVANKFADIASDTMIKKYLDIAPVAYNTLYDMKDEAEPMWKYLEENGMNSYMTSSAVKALKAEYNASVADPVVNAPADDAPADEVSKDDKSNDEMSLGETLDEGMKLAEKVGKKPIKSVANLKVSELKTSADLIYTNTAIVEINENVSKEMFGKLYAELEDVVSKFVKSNSLKDGDVVLEMNVSSNSKSSEDQLPIAA